MTEKEYRESVVKLLSKLLARIDRIEGQLNDAMKKDYSVLGDK